ncbi:hypothetical protein J4573_15035 [Actinomadura barringtoniae]|uniref:Chitin-binding type-3 domain-containing protein n=1 Tax=Actinomadura barringtoniae TaxID=1427535 RepID=A0A939P9I4_9ACTN|nr:hypothetical protein [Actinomadura barringtoniae]MBO2448415.1 hypothetical protein [Actinomadura barringtoniae]
MRVRAAVVTLGIAGLTLGTLTTPAHASSWTPAGVFKTKYACVDAGQAYVREGWNEYSCTTTKPPSTYSLWIR